MATIETLGKTVRHGAIYLTGNILRRAVSLIMLPIYTRCLTPADYGTLELLSLIIDFTAIIVGLRIGQAIFRFYNTYEREEDRGQIISTSLILIGVLNAFGVLAIFGLSGPIASVGFGSAAYGKYLSLFSFTLLLQSFVEIPLTFIRAQQRPFLFVSVSTLNLMLKLGLNILFVVHLKMRVEGVILSELISGGISAAILIAYTLRSTGIHFSVDKAKELTKFSWPLILTSLLSFFLNFGDRYFLRIYGDLSQVGIYSLGYRFGYIFTFLVWQPFNSIWDYQKYEIYNQSNAKEIFQKIFLLLSMLSLICALTISIFSRDVLRLMADPAFWGAHQVVPIILAAFILQGWGSYCNLGILIEKKTIYLTEAVIFADLVALTAFLGLVPRYGVFGTAWGFLLGYMAYLWWIERRARRFYDMRLPWKKLILPSVLAVIAYLAALHTPGSFGLSIALRGLLVAFVMAIYLWLPILSSEEKRHLADRLVRVLCGAVQCLNNNKPWAFHLSLLARRKSEK